MQRQHKLRWCSGNPKASQTQEPTAVWAPTRRLQGSHSATSTVCAVAIRINVVSHLAVVNNLAVGWVRPVQVLHCIHSVRSRSWACHCRVCKGAVVPVYTCVTHANNLTTSIQACITLGPRYSLSVSLHNAYRHHVFFSFLTSSCCES